MRVLIIGGGTVGSLLIKNLRENAKITVIERDMHRCEWLAQRYEGVEVINAKAEDTDELNEVGIDNFDIIFVVTGNQGVNIVTSLYLKHNGAKRIICKLNTPNYIEMLDEIGIESICEDIVTAQEFIRKSFSPILSKLVSSKMALEEIENIYASATARDLVEEGIYPLVILREEVVFFPDLDEKILEGDRLFRLKHV